MSHKQWLFIGLILLGAQIGLIGFTYFEYYSRKPVQYYGNPPENTPFPLAALDRPNVSSKALLNWVTLAATASFTLDFVNYRSNLQAIKDYFTVDGYSSFVDSLNAAGTLSTIDEKKLVLTAVAVGPAIILTEGIQHGVYAWQVQVPLLVRYQSASTNETNVKLVSMLVTQVPTNFATKGIGIAQYVAADAGSDYAGYTE